MRSVAWLAMGLLLLCGSLVRAEIEGEEFSSETWRIRLTGPKNWQMTDQTAYPNILLRMERRDPAGVILLTAEQIIGKRAQDYALDVVKRLEELGFKTRAPALHATTGAFVIDFDNGKAYLRQALLVIDNIGYSLTLSAPDPRIRGQHLRAFEGVLRNLRPLRRTSEEASP